MNTYLEETYSQHYYHQSFLTQNMIIKPINKKMITLDIPALCEEKNVVNNAKNQGPRNAVILPDKE